MKRKLNAIIATTILGMMASAYAATCYLEQIVVCAVAGDNLGTYDLDLGGGSTLNATLYADTRAYRVGTYSTGVTRGGFNRTSFNSLCDTIGNVYLQIGGASAGSGFSCWYDPTGAGSTGFCQSTAVTPGDYTQASFYANQGSTCN